MTKEIFIKKIQAADYKKWLANTKEFLAPLALIYVVFIIVGVEKDGIQLADFVPTNAVISAGALYVLNVLKDLLGKIKRAEIK